MAVEDMIMQDLTPGMQVTIDGTAKRHNVAYATAARALRNLWRHEFVNREKKGRILWYEGKQERLL